jgi:hypothetical protein
MLAQDGPQAKAVTLPRKKAAARRRLRRLRFFCMTNRLYWAGPKKVCDPYHV